MELYKLFQKLADLSPATKISFVAFIFAALIEITLPIKQLQELFWTITILGFLIGDSLTTGYLSKFGLEEQEKGYTRWACGAEPTLRCAAMTRIIVFGTVFSIYILAIKSRLLWEYATVQTAVLMTPVVFGLMGTGATVANSYAMWRVRKIRNGS